METKGRRGGEEFITSDGEGTKRGIWYKEGEGNRFREREE